MTKTLAILLGLAVVWATAWTITGVAVYLSGSDELALAEHVRPPAAELVRGAEVRVEGTIAEGPRIKSLYSQTECLAGYVHVSLWHYSWDSQNRPTSKMTSVAKRWVGPETIGITVGYDRIELPLERWVPTDAKSNRVEELPARLGVTQAEIEKARAELDVSDGVKMVGEATLHAGTRYFVIGRLEDREGPLLLEPDPRFPAVVLFPGTKQQYLQELTDGAATRHMMAWIFGSLGPPPLLIVALVWWRRSRKRKAELRAAGGAETRVS